jgi:hypothetical protein
MRPPFPLPAQVWVRLEEGGAEPVLGEIATLTPRRRRPGRPAVLLDRTEPAAGAFEVQPAVLRPGWGAVAVVSLLHRRRDLDLAGFSAHWAGPHSRFALCLPAAVGYLQLHAMRAGAALDGIAVTLFDDVTAARTAMASPLITIEAREDEARFLDADRCTSYLCDAVLAPAATAGMPG